MSNAPYKQIATEQHGDVHCVGLRNPRLRFTELDDLISELDRFVADSKCNKLVFLLGPEEPQCLYSLFLAKLDSATGILDYCSANPARLKAMAETELGTTEDDALIRQIRLAVSATVPIDATLAVRSQHPLLWALAGLAARCSVSPSPRITLSGLVGASDGHTQVCAVPRLYSTYSDSEH